MYFPHITGITRNVLFHCQSFIITEGCKNSWNWGLFRGKKFQATTKKTFCGFPYIKIKE